MFNYFFVSILGKYLDEVLPITYIRYFILSDLIPTNSSIFISLIVFHQVLLIKYGFLFVFKYLNSSYGDIMIKGTILKQPTVDRDGGANHHDDYTVDCVYRSSLSETLNA